ncbi:hypothetical protein COCSUDRAFT_59336 [Coccomyxa subellipsoidea C-169]|uniref:RING-type domain-containing protein n=1 Tax=Coccomyxa subellipsoidea (strain C-169) TaxID=574566 RepID=I0Z859_COCSC|nr:hypothetical protein COCSUDRAFT_59336 [Coccomyxa subellipsoidea C-169]EIE26828.1 hypothetical protein COCSUDRAFT_59336 [Coccomyxa subellipsoidea C-169]|eukprot:XP_005651372.1 hypothetical protein COCSUDRAFT_59336 [Coccomyxa subellipsoidea C-169]
MPQENRKRNRVPVVSLLSPDPDTDIGRPLKRPQRDMSAPEAHGMPITDVVDLSGDSPQSEKAAACGSPFQEADMDEGHALWGELDESPPRWRQVRRRTQAPRGEQHFQPPPPPPPPPVSRGLPTRPTAWRARASGAGGRMHSPSGRPVGMPGAAAALRASGGDRLRTRSQSRHDSDEDLDDPTRAMDDFVAQRRAELEALRADEALAQRMDELEAMEMWANGDPAPEWHGWRARSGAAAARPRGQPHFAGPQPPPPPGRGRRRGWANAASIAEVVMGMFAGAGPLAGPFTGLDGPSGGHWSAMREAFAGMSQSRLPPHLLFTERDFDENDYEALLALDEAVESRKGASAQQIEHLPTVIVGASGVGPDKECKCPICLEDFSPGAVLHRLPCTHQFHRDCVDKWLTQKATCPICQQCL